MNRRWPDGPPPTTAGTGVRTVREAVGDVFGKATTWRAEIDADARNDLINRAKSVLIHHDWIGDNNPGCLCGWRESADEGSSWYRHVAEQLAAAGLLNP